jgi:NTP pyrophosphatase (non-canonical NTP hydrolase)
MNSKQKEVLLIAQEECAEVIQAISKIFRFGFDSKWPEDGDDNRERLTEEIGDLLAMIKLLSDFDVIDPSNLENLADKKIIKLKKWSNLFKE